MARRTIKRNPLSVDTDDYDLEEKYFNFAEFKGINSNKNYITIDQQSFEDAKNVYVDQNSQLSTRPVTKRISIIPSTEKIVNIVKVNNLTIYHTVENTTYRLRFKYKDEWYVNPSNITIQSDIKIINIDSRYIVFMPTDVVAFEYNYDKGNEFNWFTADELIYVPVTQIIPDDSTDPNAIVENKNIFTDKEIIRYIFTYDMPIDTQLINGKEVEITIGSEKFTIAFVQNNQLIFTTPISTFMQDVDVIVASANDIPIYLAYEYESDRCYLSYDADVFVELMYPGNNEAAKGCAIFLSDDGARLFYHHKRMTSSNSATLWYLDIPSSPLDINSNNWQSIEYTLSFNPFYNYADSRTGSSYNMVSTRWTNVIIDPGNPGHYTQGSSINIDCFRPFAHSPSSQYAIIIMPASGGYTTWENSSTIYSESGTSQSDDSYGSGAYIMIIYNGTSSVPVRPYFGINYGAEKHSNIKFCDNNKVKLTVTNSVFHMAYFSAWYLNTNQADEEIDNPADKLISNVVIFNENLEPYYNFEKFSIRRTSTNGRTEKLFVAKSYVSDIGFMPDVDSSDGIQDLYNATDFRGKYRDGTFLLKAVYPNNNTDEYLSTSFTSPGSVSGWSSSYYTDTYDYSNMPSSGSNQYYGTRGEYPYTTSQRNAETTTLSTVVSERYILSEDADVVLTDTYLYYNNQKYMLLERHADNSSTAYTNNPVWINLNGTEYTYYTFENHTFYTNNFGTAYTEYTIDGDDHVVFPDLLEQFITISFVKNNLLYQSVKRGGQIYFPENTEVEFIDDITAMVIFSQTSLGIFLENNVYEYQYNSDNDYYVLTPTKLQLGCKKDSDVLLSYDGATILLTNIKGLTGLTYQDFVQSTEQIYSYLTENIMDLYDEYAIGPIKLYQYKNWVFMYRQDTNLLYVYDTRNSSWWKWELLYNVTKILWNNEDLLIQMNDTLYAFDFDSFSIYDDSINPIEWYFVSQKLHFNAPNYYKTIKQLSVITTQPSKELRYKLKFKNYHNIYNLVDTDTVEFEVQQLSTLIKRVTFMKLNAFQFAISNDSTDKYPTPFVVPDIAIQYRITERVR